MTEKASTWKLNSLLDSLTLELDRAQDTLSVKGMNRRLSYTVKDMAVDLQLFPTFDGRELRWRMANAGDSGAAKISFQLGSITDRQIREVAREPPQEGDLRIEALEDIDEDTRADLERVGVQTVADVERMRSKGVDLGERSGSKVDYGKLARAIQKARRRRSSPSVSHAQVLASPEGKVLALGGENLALHAPDERFPRAYIDGVPVRVLSSGPSEMRILAPPRGKHVLMLVLDAFTIVELPVNC